MTAKKNNQNQKLYNTRSATKTMKKSTKQHIMDNINAGNKTIESSSTTVPPANVKSKNNKNVKHNASRKKPNRVLASSGVIFNSENMRLCTAAS